MFEKKGHFSVRLVYNMLVATRQRREAWLEGTAAASRSNIEEGSWKALWKTEVPGKLRMFLWRLAKQSLPTEDIRAHRHMATSSSCGFCGALDSWRHSLLDCTVSRCTWALVDEDLSAVLVASTETNARNWLFTLIESLSHDQFITVAVTLWAIWTSRRKAIHEGIFQTPHAIYTLVKHFIGDLVVVRDREPRRTRPVQTTSAPRRPKAPPENFVKIQVDAGVRASRGGSAAAVCKDRNGVYLGSSALVIVGVADPSTLEAIACREAIALAPNLNVHQAMITSDSKQVIGDIHGGNQGIYGPIISEIKARASLLNCTFSFEGRATNRDAHSLAKFALSLALGRHVWLGQPHTPTRIPHSVVFH
jgi:hypothetical protein